MGEKGSIKNLYKAWRLFLEEKKKEKQKNKKTSKIKAFGVTFFTFLLSPFFFGRKKEYKKSIKQIDLLISEIGKENNFEILEELKKVLKIEKDKIQKADFTSFEKNKKFKLIEKAEKEIEFKIEAFRKETEERNVNISVQTQENQLQIKQQKMIIESSLIFGEIKSKTDIESTRIVQKKSTLLKDPDILEFLNYIKLEISTIEHKLKTDLNLFQLKYIKSRITELNNKRENFKDNYDLLKISELYKSKDKYKILESNQTLERLYNQCDLKIEQLSEEEKEKRKKKLKQENINLEEIKKINEYLQKEIKKQQLQISKLKLIIAKTEKKFKKTTLLMNIKNMITNSIKICMVTVPISFFKNRLISGLANAFMLNNSIRGIRNLINEEQIEYAKLLSNINNQKDLIFHTRLVYEDTITQIEFLKYDLLSHFSFNYLKDVFPKLYEIGEELKRKNKILSDLEVELFEQYDKTRENVKRKIN